ncbi:hypothetical protein WJX72_012318 [[Myrmecia] bisecta]|uniref:Uncharacterized protein n=1 Tax=[Myrmecia] bisecta TaxID=41462 RepID=A0AAW1P7M1_9CHLO
MCKLDCSIRRSAEQKSAVVELALYLVDRAVVLTDNWGLHTTIKKGISGPGVSFIETEALHMMASRRQPGWLLWGVGIYEAVSGSLDASEIGASWLRLTPEAKLPAVLLRSKWLRDLTKRGVLSMLISLGIIREASNRFATFGERLATNRLGFVELASLQVPNEGMITTVGHYLGCTLPSIERAMRKTADSTVAGVMSGVRGIYAAQAYGLLPGAARRTGNPPQPNVARLTFGRLDPLIPSGGGCTAVALEGSSSVMMFNTQTSEHKLRRRLVRLQFDQQPALPEAGV